jgi:hypothetical protein
MARVSGIESGSPTPTACERTRLTCKFADLIADDVHIAQLAHASRDRVRNLIIGDERVDHGAGTIDGLARIGSEENRAGCRARDFAHGFKRQIVSVDVQSLQEQFSVPVLSFQFSVSEGFVSGHRF